MSSVPVPNLFPQAYAQAIRLENRLLRARRPSQSTPYQDLVFETQQLIQTLHGMARSLAVTREAALAQDAAEDAAFWEMIAAEHDTREADRHFMESCAADHMACPGFMD